MLGKGGQILSLQVPPGMHRGWLVSTFLRFALRLLHLRGMDEGPHECISAPAYVLQLSKHTHTSKFGFFPQLNT